MIALAEKMKQYIRFYRMIEPGDKLVVAVSGGPDSVALLHLLCDLRDELGFSLCIAHLNHMARGPDSFADAEFVSRLGEGLKLDTYVEAINVKENLADLKTSFQEGARILRYRFLESVMKKCSGNKIVVGHNADDQVETVLINFFRGSGLKGLAGIPPVRGAIIRPMLSCSRSEIETYLDIRKLSSRSDRSNSAMDYLRNRIRLDLIPNLENKYSKNFKSHVLQMAEITREDEDFLDSQVREFLSLHVPEAGKQLSIKVEDICPLHLAMQKRVIRQVVSRVLGDLRRVSMRHIEAVRELLQAPGLDKQIHLPGSLVVRRQGNELKFNIEPNRGSGISTKVTGDIDWKTELNIPGFTEIKAASLSLHARLIPKEDKSYNLVPAHHSFLDFDKTGKRIIVRFFRPGDRFIPLGMKGTKKLKSFFIDEKVPREERKFIPILTTLENDVIWVYGKRIAQDYRVTPGTKNVLFIEGVPGSRDNWKTKENIPSSK